MVAHVQTHWHASEISFAVIQFLVIYTAYKVDDSWCKCVSVLVNNWFAQINIHMFAKYISTTAEHPAPRGGHRWLQQWLVGMGFPCLISMQLPVRSTSTARDWSWGSVDWSNRPTAVLQAPSAQTIWANRHCQLRQNWICFETNKDDLSCL